NCYQVHTYAPSAEIERTQLRRASSEFAEQQEENRDPVADVQSDKRERNQRIECCRTANVDDGQKAADDDDEHERANWHMPAN
ncbi:MAG: hypothetical protein Q9225_007966, partial [Loekoesia sp. 1 TL-2023]